MVLILCKSNVTALSISGCCLCDWDGLWGGFCTSSGLCWTTKTASRANRPFWWWSTRYYFLRQAQYQHELSSSGSIFSRTTASLCIASEDSRQWLQISCLWQTRTPNKALQILENVLIILQLWVERLDTDLWKKTHRLMGGRLEPMVFDWWSACISETCYQTGPYGQTGKASQHPSIPCFPCSHVHKLPLTFSILGFVFNSARVRVKTIINGECDL